MGSKVIKALINRVTEVCKGVVVVVGQAAFLDELPQAFDQMKVGILGG